MAPCGGGPLDDSLLIRDPTPARRSPLTSMGPGLTFQQARTPSSTLSFAQREYHGFRGRRQYDKKRLVCASATEVQVLGLGTVEKGRVLASKEVEGLVHAQFVDELSSREVLAFTR